MPQQLWELFLAIQSNPIPLVFGNIDGVLINPKA